MSKTYAEKLKDPRWQQKRLRILERDEWTCLACDAADRTLHVHHKAYDGEPWDIADELLETLCEQCHDQRKETDKFLCGLVKSFSTCGANELMSLFVRVGDLLYSEIDDESRRVISPIESPMHFGRAWFRGLQSILNDLILDNSQTQIGEPKDGINQCGSECPPRGLQSGVRIGDTHAYLV